MAYMLEPKGLALSFRSASWDQLEREVSISLVSVSISAAVDIPVRLQRISTFLYGNCMIARREAERRQSAANQIPVPENIGTIRRRPYAYCLIGQNPG